MSNELESFIAKLEAMKYKLEARVSGDDIIISHNELGSVFDLNPYYKANVYYNYEPSIIIRDRVKKTMHPYEVGSFSVDLPYDKEQFNKAMLDYNGVCKDRLLESIDDYYCDSFSIRKIFELRELSDEALLDIRMAMLDCLREVAINKEYNLSIRIKDLISHSKTCEHVSIEIDNNPKKLLYFDFERVKTNTTIESIIDKVSFNIRDQGEAIKTEPSVVFSVGKRYLRDLDLALQKLKKELQ